MLTRATLETAHAALIDRADHAATVAADENASADVRTAAAAVEGTARIHASHIRTQLDLRFDVGDGVRLNSGGPSMTVVRVVGEGAVCAWQVNSRPESRFYPFEVLTKDPQ